MMRLVARLITICALAIIASVATSSMALAEPKHVVFLHSYGQNFKPWSEYSRALRQELERKSRWPLDLQDFSVITARSGNENAERQFTDYLGALYAHRAPDLIVAFGAPAGDFVQRQRSRLFPSTPMVMTAIDQRRVQESALTENDSVVAVRQDIPLLFANILKVLPGTNTVAVLIGNSPNERFWLGEMQKELEPLKDRVKFLFLNDLSFEDMLKQAASLPPNSAIWWNQPQVDATGEVQDDERALKALHAVAKAPIFSYDDAFFGGEIVGGPMTSVADGARTTSEVALRILEGEKPASIKTPVLKYGPAKYDWRQLQRWGISQSRLPAGSQIYFQAPTTWELYRWQIMLVAAVILTQAALISVLIFERQRRHFAEVQARQRSAELAHINRYSMAGELTASIAHEINQPLGSILANIEAAQLLIRSSTPDMNEIKEILADIRRDDERASEVIQRLRSLLKKAPFELRNIDLNQSARETVEFLSALAIARRVVLDSAISSVPLPIRGDRIQLQQVIVNLVVNAMDAMSHAPSEGRKITIHTARNENCAEISVTDAGPGIQLPDLEDVFEPFFSTKPQGMGMGLSIARTIVEAHNGRIWAENQARSGAVFRIQLPLAAD